MNLEELLWNLTKEIENNDYTKAKICIKIKKIIKNYFVYEEKLLQSVIT